MSNFKRLLREGDTVKITNFEVEDNVLGKFQKARVNHDFKLHFSFTTKVVGCRPDLSILSNGFNLVPFDDLVKLEGSFYVGTCFLYIYTIVLYNNYFIPIENTHAAMFADVIGEITNRGEVSYVDKARARVLEVEVRDER